MQPFTFQKVSNADMIIYSILEFFFVLVKNSGEPNLATVAEAHSERQSCENSLSLKLCDCT